MATKKLWDSGGERRDGAAAAPGLDPLVDAFLSSTSVDSRLLSEDLRGSRAHAAMLGRQGILSPEVAASLDAGLAALEEEAASAVRGGATLVDPGAEDVHSWVEAELTGRLGEAGKALHAGRSRNDQVALDLRLWLRGASLDLRRGIAGLIGALCDLAEGHATTIMPGYTHLQRAQPVSLAHHLLAWCAALERDLGRFADAAARADECPLGACALAGTGLPIDREATALSLGFSRPGRNSMDDVADRDACVEFAAAGATLLMHLSRYCEEIILWSSAEFGFMKIGPSCSTGSSVMPQKRNPDPAELIRGKSGRAYGALVNLLVIQKGLPLAYNRDLQEDKAAVFDAAETALAAVRAFSLLARALEPQPERMRAAAEDGCLWAADAAEFLVLRGVAFRTAYVAGRKLVEAWIRRMEEGGRGTDPGAAALLGGLGTEGLAALHPAWGGVEAAELASWLSLEACLGRRDLPGGPAPARVQAEIGRLRAWLAAG
jgi:argininosuccinate lyase